MVSTRLQNECDKVTSFNPLWIEISQVLTPAQIGTETRVSSDNTSYVNCFIGGFVVILKLLVRKREIETVHQIIFKEFAL